MIVKYKGVVCRGDHMKFKYIKRTTHVISNDAHLANMSTVQKTTNIWGVSFESLHH